MKRTPTQIAARVAAVLEDAPIPDFEVNDTGSIVLLQPRTEAADTWIAMNLESPTKYGTAVAAERRYIEAIVKGITHDGLTAQRS